MAVIPSQGGGLGPVRGFAFPANEGTPEEIHGGPANPVHGKPGEDAQPYSWESQLTQAAEKGGPYGAENGLLGDTYCLEGEPAGQLGHDPYSDLTPYRGHAAPMTSAASGPLGSQYDDINRQLEPAAEIRGTDLGASRKMTLSELGDAQNDQWQEIWNVEDEPSKYPAGSPQTGFSVFGFGTNDRTVNPLRKVNGYQFNMGHHHRRFATGSIPGNYMWMKAVGRPAFKNAAGIARPAIGPNSPFHGDDLGLSFGIQGAVLVEVPTEYQPPPTPQTAAPVNSDTSAPAIPLW